MTKRTLTKADILSLSGFEALRPQKRQEIMELKKKRRVFVGPFALFIFENYETLWWQIHEMLRIEKGGDEQIQDELDAYVPLLPQGKELVATFMLEIDDPQIRTHLLGQLGGIEDMIQIRMGDDIIKAHPTRDQNRTTDEGKTSSVHFLHFKMTADQALKFKSLDVPPRIQITHPAYIYEAELGWDVYESLKGDL